MGEGNPIEIIIEAAERWLDHISTIPGNSEEMEDVIQAIEDYRRGGF